MVTIAAREANGSWFGIAWSGSAFVATAIGTTRDEALARVAACLPPGTPRELADQAAFADDAAIMLAELEAGIETHKHWQIDAGSRTVASRRILLAAAAIPVGYVSTYGTVAEAAGSEARAVGRAMATNPLYPIVPCHRVVGADFSMIGYGGSQDLAAIAAKLHRLTAERRGFESRREIDLESGTLIVYPVEWVLDAARNTDRRRAEAQRKTDELTRIESLQFRLFS
ncbi:MAG: MGMT family protein [Spirochaetota bacterium]